MTSQGPSEISTVETPHELAAEDVLTIDRLFEQVYSTGELHIVEELVAPTFRGYCTGTDDVFRGPDGAKSHVIRLRSAIVGLDFTLDDVQESSDGIEVQWTATGRLERPIMGVQPVCTIGRAGDEPGGPEVRVTGKTTAAMTEEVVRESVMEWNLDELRSQVEQSRYRRTSGINDTVPPRGESSR